MMDGGYILPEYGVAYIKKVHFFQENSQKERLTDVIVAACKYFYLYFLIKQTMPLVF